MSEENRPGEFDLHGHTKYSRIPEFVNYSPQDAILRAKEVGLDGIAITGHDTIEGLDEALNMGAKHGIVVVPGIEISTLSLHRGRFRTPHVLALGTDPELLRSSRYVIPRFKGITTVADWVHDHGGFVVAAHAKPKGGHNALSYDQVKHYQDKWDGIETVTTFGKNYDMEALAKELHIAGLGSSDFHMLAQVGLVGTRINGAHSTWQEVIQALQDQKVEAFVRTDIPKELQGERSTKVLLRQILGEKL